MKHIRLPSGEYVENRRNGTASKLVWTTMLSACGVIFIGFMAWMTSMNSHLTNVEATMNLRWERLSAVETTVKAIEPRLIRIEEKIDRFAIQKTRTNGTK